jgi:CRP-like cAMP-binding protein
MIVDQDLIKLVKKNRFFRNIDPSFLDTFIKAKNFFVAREGNLLYTYSDVSDRIILVVEGEVKIKFAEAKLVEFRYLLDFFGEKEILDTSDRVSAAIANKESILYQINLGELNALKEIYPVINENLIMTGEIRRDAITATVVNND